MMLSKRWVSLVSLCVINVETNSFSKTSSNILNSLIDVLKFKKKKKKSVTNFYTLHGAISDVEEF